MGVLRERLGASLERSLLNARMTYSTQFTGMGTVEAAMEIAQEQASRCGLALRASLASTTDLATTCRTLLLAATPMESCVFDNILGAVKFPNSVHNPAASLNRRLSLAMKARLAEQAFCHRHQRKCCIPRPFLLAAGTPCVDWSAAGKRLGFKGPTTGCTLAWLRLAATCGVALHENVPQFPPILEELLHHHHVYLLQMNPCDIGFHLVRRPRSYRLVVHKSLALLANPIEVFEHIKLAFKRRRKVPFQAVLRKIKGNSRKALLRRRCRCVSKCSCTFRSQLSAFQARHASVRVSDMS